MISFLLAIVVAAGSGSSLRDARRWVEAAAWLAETRCPDDCWSILDYDLLEWPEGRVALDGCLLKFHGHFSKGDRSACEDHCGWTRGEQLAMRADEQTAERAAQWECTWAVEETNARRIVAGRRELDEYELCWAHGSTFWRQFYEAPRRD